MSWLHKALVVWLAFTYAASLDDVVEEISRWEGRYIPLMLNTSTLYQFLPSNDSSPFILRSFGQANTYMERRWRGRKLLQSNAPVNQLNCNQ